MANKFRTKPAEEPVQPAAVEPEATVEPVVEEQPAESVKEQTAKSGETAAIKGRGDRAARGLGHLLGGDVLTNRAVLRQIPLLLLCLFYLLLIVGNRYRVETLSRDKAATEERINFLREHRIQMQKQYQRSVKISQIAEELQPLGVGITNGPPYEIEK
ncbi:MAG: hypothetical protein J6W88_03855 [Bacteroidales bacterium]|nr:hypothetical protein [Bacteroidales bacterium]